MKLAPPPRPARQRRHSMTTVRLARQMYGEGDSWTPTQIMRYLAEQGIEVSVNTVRAWVIPSFGEEQRRLNLESYYRRRRGQGHSDVDVVAGSVAMVWAISEARASLAARPTPARGAPTTADLNARMLTLRGADLSFLAISKVIEVDLGVRLSGDQVRHRLRALGVKPVAWKSDLMRRKWAEEKAAA